VIAAFGDEALGATLLTGVIFSQIYTSHFSPALKRLEAGNIRRSCAVFLNRTMNCHFSNGCVLSECIDHRFSSPRDITARLEIAPDISQDFGEGH
jgi:hypothetical protein